MTSAVRSGGDGEAAAGGLRSSLLVLIDQKTDLEARIAVLGNVLTSQRVGMDDPLVDDDGYPRGDIDVYSVRHARSQLRRLQNDHGALMARIEAGLAQLHGGQPAADASSAPAAAVRTTPVAFLQVTAVGADSPAAGAGLETGDQLTAIGSVCADNFASLADVSGVVQHSVGRPLVLRVLRDGRAVSLLLTPRAWAGHGLLGCVLVPIDRPQR